MSKIKQLSAVQRKAIFARRRRPQHIPFFTSEESDKMRSGEIPTPSNVKMFRVISQEEADEREATKRD